MVTFSQNPKLKCPDLLFSCEKDGFESVRIQCMHAVVGVGFWLSFKVRDCTNKRTWKRLLDELLLTGFHGTLDMHVLGYFYDFVG